MPPHVTPNPVVELVPDTDDHDDDADSAFDGASQASSTESLSSSIFRHRMENGRQYHAYKEGKYVLPNDDIENERLEIQHHMFTLTFDGPLYICPAGQDKPLKYVLDCGTGTGSWAIDFADENQQCEVIGVDLSPIQPSFIPPNLSFFVDDIEEPWTYSKKFDFIYIRMLTGSILDWPKLFAEAYKLRARDYNAYILLNLNPGGWIEIADITFPIESDDNTIPADSSLRKWSSYMIEASNNLKRPLESAKLYRQQLIDQGFANVVERRYKWPQNSWPKDPKFKHLGAWSYENIVGGLSGLSMALFTRGLGWNAEQLEVFLADVRRDMRNTQIHSYYTIYVVYGQKQTNEVV